MGSVLIGSIRGPRGDPGPKGEPGIQGVPGPLPPLVNNYLPVQEGTAAADAAILHDIDSRIENTKDSLSKVALSGRAPDVETDEDHRFVTDDEKNEWNGKVDASGGDISETVVGTLDNITESFPVPAAGEKPRTFLGKVRKNLQDWKNLKDTLLTLNRLVNNGQTTASGYALDARYGKTLYDLYAQLNSNLSKKVNTSDVINALNNVTTNKPLSAAQGKALNDALNAKGVVKIHDGTSGRIEGDGAIAVMCTFTAPKAGYYLFYGHVQFVGTGENGSRGISISSTDNFGIQYSEVPGAKDCWPG